VTYLVISVTDGFTVMILVKELIAERNHLDDSVKERQKTRLFAGTFELLTNSLK